MPTSHAASADQQMLEPEGCRAHQRRESTGGETWPNLSEVPTDNCAKIGQVPWDRYFATVGFLVHHATSREGVAALARNTRLVAMIEEELATARAAAEKAGRPARRFKDFQWSTLDTWSRRRRVVAKAEWTKGEANPRFVVTSLKRAEAGARQLYEDIYCARGEMENRIKECQLDLYADRTSAQTIRANQLRLWFASMAYVLICALRRIGLVETPFADATCGSIRLKLLKIGALVRISVRRIKIAMASAAAQKWGYVACRLAEAAKGRASPA
jgi:Transposase DDE domain group 1